jgi:arylsulfatase A-like enzyme
MIGHSNKASMCRVRKALELYTILLLAFVYGCGRQTEPLNVLFIFSDDHAYQAISAYGSTINATPHIDRLANEGMRFNRCYVTNSICAPSRAVIQSGKYSHLNGVLTNVETFDGSQQTFPKLLQQHGYQTAIVGKWHLKSQPEGFDYAEVLPGQGKYYNPDMIKMGQDVTHTGYVTDIITDLALDWLNEKRDPAKPFMLMLQHKAPHREWQPALRHLTLYDDVTIPEPFNLFDDYAGRGSAAKNQEITILRSLKDVRDMKLAPPENLTADQLEIWNQAYTPKNEAFQQANPQGDELLRWKFQRYIKDYLRTVASLDENIGRVLQYLEETGLADNTVVVYASDQGFYLGEHGWYDKRFMFEQSLRTPLIVRWPGITAPGSVNEDIVSNLDFAQTILDIAGAPQPADMQGRSLAPVLEGQTPDDWRTTHYYHYYQYKSYHNIPRHEGVTNGRHKLIWYYDLKEWELYDLEQDPHEMNSVYGEPANAKIIADLKQELERLRRQYQVPPNEPLPEPE